MVTSSSPQTTTPTSQMRRSVVHRTRTHFDSPASTADNTWLTGRGPFGSGFAAFDADAAAGFTSATAIRQAAMIPIRRPVLISVPPVLPAAPPGDSTAGRSPHDRRVNHAITLISDQRAL